MNGQGTAQNRYLPGNRIALLSPHPGRVRAEINGHAWNLDSQGGQDFQQASQRIHRLLFEHENAPETHDTHDSPHSLEAA